MKRLKALLSSTTLLLTAVLPLPAAAQSVVTPKNTITGFGSVLTILTTLLSWIYTIFFIVAAIIIIIAAFNFLTAGGDEEKIGKAKTQFVYAIVAIVVAVIATSVKFVVRSLIPGADVGA